MPDTAPLQTPTSGHSHSLDYLQTTGHRPFPAFISTDLQASYARTLRELRKTADWSRQGERLYHRLRRCFDDFRCYYDPDSQAAWMRPTRCYLRICPVCSAARARSLAYRFEQLTQRCRHPMFWTLTLRNSHRPIDEQFQRITTLFKTLRRQAFWKDHVRGGFWVFDITYNRQTDCWHPHLHMILDTRWLPHHKFKKHWLELTGDSFVIHFHNNLSRAHAAHHCSKYFAKVFDPSHLPKHRWLEWALQTRGIRFWSSFGCCYGKTRPLSETRQDPAGTIRLGLWSERDLWPFPRCPVERRIVLLQLYTSFNDHFAPPRNKASPPA